MGVWPLPCPLRVSGAEPSFPLGWATIAAAPDRSQSKARVPRCILEGAHDTRHRAKTVKSEVKSESLGSFVARSVPTPRPLAVANSSPLPPARSGRAKVWAEPPAWVWRCDGSLAVALRVLRFTGAAPKRRAPPRPPQPGHAHACICTCPRGRHAHALSAHWYPGGAVARTHMQAATSVYSHSRAITHKHNSHSPPSHAILAGCRVEFGRPKLSYT